MTQQETARVRQQDRVVKRLRDFEAKELKQEKDFGGAYLDRRNGDEVVVLAVRGSETYRERVRAAVPEARRVRSEPAHFAKAALADQFEQAVVEADSLRDGGVPVSGSRLDVQQNRVVVTVSVDATDDHVRRVQASLPDAMVVREEGAPSTLSRWDTGGHPT